MTPVPVFVRCNREISLKTWVARRSCGKMVRKSTRRNRGRFRRNRIFPNAYPAETHTARYSTRPPGTRMMLLTAYLRRRALTAAYTKFPLVGDHGGKKGLTTNSSPDLKLATMTL